MREILQLTHPAKLVKFKRGLPPNIDKQLLMIRKEITQ
jgi:hypothetical protein